MKLLVVLALVAAAIAYEGKVDKLDIDELIGNDRLVLNMCHCLTKDVKCTAEGNEIKQWIPEAIENSCAKCTDKQKHDVGKFMKVVKTKFNPEYVAICQKYDPDNKYAESLQKFIETYGN